MSSNASLLTRLTDPIPGDNPCGRWMRYENAYDIIQHARTEEDASLPQGVWKRDLKEADWKKVERVAIEALETQTKDLQIAAWLTEAWLQIDGISGLNRGLRLIDTLAERYWETLYPDLADLDFRLRPIDWLNEKATERLRLYPVSVPTNPQAALLYFYEWLKYEKTPSAAVQSKIEKKILGTTDSFYHALEEGVQEGLSLIQHLETTLSTKVDEEAIHLYKLKNMLENLLRFNQYARTLHTDAVKDPVEESSVSSSQENSTQDPSYPSPLALSFTNRDEAYEVLDEIAGYLEAIDPHSPTPYLIRRAVAWGNMNLAQLISEFSQEPGGVEHLMRLLGLDQATDSDLWDQSEDQG